MIFDDVKVFLPKFLSADNEKDLYSCLKEFPSNLDSRFYTDFLKESKIIYQGDAINNLLIVDFKDKLFKGAPCLIFSNTCDSDISNSRLFPSQIVYAPLFNLRKYEKSLLKNSKKDQSAIQAHIDAIKRQEITQIFYLPSYSNKLEESIVFLDRVYNYPSKGIDRENLTQNRIFTLGNYGAYIFLLKLSIHFTRIKDSVDRNKEISN